MEEDEDVFEDDLDILNNIHQFANRPRLDSRMSVCLPTKGLYNGPGMNNCFLNSCVQLLWHLNVFRRSFRLLDGHACTEDACIFCALKTLFYQFEDSDASTVDPNALREAMANSFMYDHRFQLGRMDDAAECLENLLQRLHCHIAVSEEADTCTASYCIPHQKFACSILEQVSCRCNSTGEPKSYYQYVHYVTAAALASSSVSVRNGKLLSLGAMLRDLNQTSEKRPCPDERRCKYRENKDQVTTSIRSTLLNSPDVVSVGIIWDTDRPNPKYINDVMGTVTEHLCLSDMFDNVNDELKSLELKLAGVITYYGRHYTSFFYNIREKQWVHFDDARVDKIGSDWSNVTEKCYYCRYQPLLFVYTNASGLTVNTEEAPKIIKRLSQERLLTRTSYQRKIKRRRNTHRNKHRKQRSRSHSPLPETLSDEQHSSSNSNQSSPEKTKLSNTNGQLASLPHKRSASHSPHRKLKTFDGVINRDKEDLNSRQHSFTSQPMKYSNSESSILDMKAVNGGESTTFPVDFDENSSQRTRSGSLKKRFENAFKNINPYLSKQKNKYIKTKNENGLTSSLDESNYADVGFRANHPMQEDISQQGSRSQFYLDTSRNSSACALSCDKSPTNQIDALRQHAENLNISLTEAQSKHSKRRNIVNSASDDQIVKKSNLPPSTHLPPRDYMDRPNSITYANSNGYSDDLIYFNSRLDVVPCDRSDIRISENRILPQIPIAGEFESMISKGERLVLQSQTEEERGDIPLALRLSTEATAAFRDAFKLNNHNDDLIEYIDSKRHETFHRSKYLQNKLNPLIAAATQVANQSVTKTSDYGSMSDPSSSEPNTPSWDSQMSSQKMDELVAIQNSNAKRLAMERVFRENPSAISKPREYTGKTIYDRNNAAQSNYVPTDVRWVIDRPNDSYNSLRERLVVVSTDDTLRNDKTGHSGIDNGHWQDDIIQNNGKTLPNPQKNSGETIYTNENKGTFTLKKFVNNVAAKISEKVDTENFDTLQKLRLKKFKKNRCAQCGIREVDIAGQFCGSCQSEYL